MPDATTIMIFILAVFGTPLRWAGTFVFALAIVIYLVLRVKELIL